MFQVVDHLGGSMDNFEGQMSELRNTYHGKDIQIQEEAGIKYILIPAFKLPEGCKPEVVDLLLCPVPRDGYPSRLYFKNKLDSPAGLNWNGCNVILREQWYAYSWKLNGQGTLLGILLGHLRAVK
jgi:hypothetical protein